MVRNPLADVRRHIPVGWRQRVKTAISPVTDRLAPSYSNTGEEEIVARLLSDCSPRRFCVDIAASDGRTMSNTLALYQRRWAGLAVEMDGLSFKALAARHARFPDSSLFRGRVTPDNVLDLLRAASVPADFGFLSLDIDGYDFYILDRMLSEYRPTLICAEINEKIPPPLRFTVKYRPDYVPDGSHFYGQSICQLAVLCERHEYAIVQLEYNNTFLMPSDLAPVSLTPTEAYRIGYQDRPDRQSRFPWNADMESVLRMSPGAAVDFLNNQFERYRGSYTLEGGSEPT